MPTTNRPNGNAPAGPQTKEELIVNRFNELRRLEEAIDLGLSTITDRSQRDLIRELNGNVIELFACARALKKYVNSREQDEVEARLHNVNVKIEKKAEEWGSKPINPKDFDERREAADKALDEELAALERQNIPPRAESKAVVPPKEATPKSVVDSLERILSHSSTGLEAKVPGIWGQLLGQYNLVIIKEGSKPMAELNLHHPWFIDNWLVERPWIYDGPWVLRVYDFERFSELKPIMHELSEEYGRPIWTELDLAQHIVGNAELSDLVFISENPSLVEDEYHMHGSRAREDFGGKLDKSRLHVEMEGGRIISTPVRDCTPVSPAESIKLAKEGYIKVKSELVSVWVEGENPDTREETWTWDFWYTGRVKESLTNKGRVVVEEFKHNPQIRLDDSW